MIKRKIRSKKLIALAMVACVAILAFALVACQPAKSNTSSSDKQVESASTGAVASVAGNFLNNDSGDFPESFYTEDYVNAGNRGCEACHADLYALIKDLRTTRHLVASQAGYGKTYSFTDCLACHSTHTYMFGPYLGDLLHSKHYSSSTFVENNNGNCWSCHATNLKGELVLWDYYKYSSDFGGYADTGTDISAMFLGKRGWNNSSVVGVVQAKNLALDVEITQPITDEKDMFAAVNYEIPSFTEESYRLNVTGVNNEKAFTLAELKAFPSVEFVATQCCNTNAVGGPMVGNIPVKGVKLADVIDACGGIKEGNITVKAIGEDTWGFPVSADLLVKQGAVLAYEYWGHELTADQGYPVTMFVPGMVGAFHIKYLTKLDFVSTPGVTNYWNNRLKVPQTAQGGLCTGWFSPIKDGQEYKVGENITLEGYASIEANNGHSMSQIAFSGDYGNTWTTVDIPADADQNQWMYWKSQWKPETAGTYVLHVKAIDAAGYEQVRPASVIIQVVE